MVTAAPEHWGQDKAQSLYAEEDSDEVVCVTCFRRDPEPSFLWLFLSRIWKMDLTESLDSTALIWFNASLASLV